MLHQKLSVALDQMPSATMPWNQVDNVKDQQLVCTIPWVFCLEQSLAFAYAS
jgi:hypothetical protein